MGPEIGAGDSPTSPAPFSCPKVGGRGIGLRAAVFAWAAYSSASGCGLALLGAGSRRPIAESYLTTLRAAGSIRNDMGR